MMSLLLDQFRPDFGLASKSLQVYRCSLASVVNDHDILTLFAFVFKDRRCQVRLHWE